MKHSYKILFVIALHEMPYHGDFSKQTIPCQGHFLLEGDKLINHLLYAGYYLGDNQFRNQNLNYHNLFPHLTPSLMFHLKRVFFSYIRTSVSSHLSNQEGLWITSPSLCDASHSPWLVGSLLALQLGHWSDSLHFNPCYQSPMENRRLLAWSRWASFISL